MADRARGKPGWGRAYSFLWITLCLFVISWVGQFVFQLTEVRNEAAEHGQAFSMGDFWPQFLASTFENWQSEFLAVGSMAIFSVYLRQRGSSQSKPVGEPHERTGAEG